MKPQRKLFDTLQFAGVCSGVLLSVILIFPVKQDPLGSAILGLGVALLFQLFDLQLRQNESERHILEAGALSQALYRNDWLFKHIRQIVEDYQLVQEGGFELFKHRAADAVIECRNTLHSMAEGHLIADLGSSFTYGVQAVVGAKISVKAAAAANPAYWRTTHAEKYLQANLEAVRRGVEFKRVFIQTPDTLREIVDLLEEQSSMGIDVYIAFTNDIPKALREDYLIVDDHIFTRLELTPTDMQRKKGFLLTQ